METKPPHLVHHPSDDLDTYRYSAFLPWQKNCIIALAAFAGWFSSISSFIYFPALPFVATDLNVDIEQVNLTVTSYLIMSGIFPSLVGDAADRFGRRPVFLLALTVYLGANIGLALQSNFALLLTLRMLQSAGISGTYSIAYGVLSDLFTPAERGGYSGILAFFIGPLLSGLLLLRWDWHSIFWFLCAAVPCCLVPMFLFLPETARGIVGDGSVHARPINRPLFPLMTPKTRTDQVQIPTLNSTNHRLRYPNPLQSLKLIKNPETAIILAAFGVNYAVYSCLQASLSSLFRDIYDVSSVTAGLSYLPFGVACAVAALGTGKLLDVNYRKTAEEENVATDKGRAQNLDNFPIERARLRTIKPIVAASAAFIIAYGWLLEARASMSGALVLQFCIGLTIQSLFTALNTLLVDIHQDKPSTAQAASNFVRCEAAAGFLAALDAMLSAMGPGRTFVLLGLLILCLVPLLMVLERKGMKWRQSKAFQGRESNNGSESSSRPGRANHSSNGRSVETHEQ